MDLNRIDPLSQVNGVFAGDAAAPAGVVQDFAAPRKVHHSFIWLGSLRLLLVIFIASFLGILPNLGELLSGGAFGEAAHAASLTFALVVAFLVITYGLIVWIRWLQFKNLSYRLTDTEFIMDSGILTKRHVQIPYQRIQAVDQQASLLQRLTGVCSLKFDTAGGASNRGVVVEYLLNADAAALREELFSRKQWALAKDAGAVPAGAVYGAAAVAGVVPGSVPAAAVAGVPGAMPYGVSNAVPAYGENAGQVAIPTFAAPVYQEPPIMYAFGLSNRELLLAGISNSSSFWAIAVAVIGAISQLVSLIIPSSLLGATTGSSAVAGAVVGIGVASILGMSVLGWLLSALGSCLRYGGFSAKRQGSRIEVQRGLVQRVYQGVDIDRVQSVIIKQGFIRRLMGYCELSLGKIESASQSDSSGQSSQQAVGIVVHPFVKVDLVPQVIAGLIPEMAWIPEPQHPQAPVALRRMMIRRLTWAGGGFWLAVFILLGLAFWGQALRGTESGSVFLAMCIIGFVIAVFIAALQIWDGVLWHRESFFAYDARGMMVRNGGFSTQTVVIPRQKIQFASLVDNPFQRRAGVTTIAVRTAAGVGGTSTSLRDVANADADAWYAWAEPRGAQR